MKKPIVQVLHTASTNSTTVGIFGLNLPAGHIMHTTGGPRLLITAPGGQIPGEQSSVLTAPSDIEYDLLGQVVGKDDPKGQYEPRGQISGQISTVRGA